MRGLDIGAGWGALCGGGWGGVGWEAGHREESRLRQNGGDGALCNCRRHRVCSPGGSLQLQAQPQ